jgi:hypothetical protein
MRAEQSAVVHAAFLEHDVMSLLLGMLLRFPTANMLHNSVQATLLAAIHSHDPALRQCLLGPSCGLLQQLLAQFELFDLERDGFQADSSVRPHCRNHVIYSTRACPAAVSLPILGMSLLEMQRWIDCVLC